MSSGSNNKRKRNHSSNRSDDNDSTNKNGKKNIEENKKTRSQHEKNIPTKPRLKKNDDDVPDELDDVIPTIKIFPFIYDPNESRRKEPPRMSRIEQLKKRIVDSGMKDSDKQYVISRLKNVDVDKEKAMEWFDNVLRIPFNQFATLPVRPYDTPNEISDYFTYASNKLDNAVYGLQDVKEDILNYVAQIIATNNNSSPRVIGLCGSAGIGKTVLIRRGLSEVLNRPMQSISMGGMKDSATFVGFEYTYSGSRFGLIAQSLMESRVMNPIIFMDELDKVSLSHEGADIQNLLIHLTDPAQNTSFQDKYFTGINIDLSKVIFVFAFNDEQRIHPILKDRIHIIRVPDPSLEAKITIGTKYLIKEICPNVGLHISNVIFSDEVMRYIIYHYCKGDKGVRGLKRCIETILLKVNTARFMGKRQKYKELKDIKFPLHITERMVVELLPEDKTEREFLSHMYM